MNQNLVSSIIAGVVVLGKAAIEAAERYQTKKFEGKVKIAVAAFTFGTAIAGGVIAALPAARERYRKLRSDQQPSQQITVDAETVEHQEK